MWEANRLDTRPLCANFPAAPYQLIKEVSERRRERNRETEREREMQEVGVGPNELSAAHE